MINICEHEGSLALKRYNLPQKLLFVYLLTTLTLTLAWMFKDFFLTFIQVIKQTKTPFSTHNLLLYSGWFVFIINFFYFFKVINKLELGFSPNVKSVYKKSLDMKISQVKN